VPPEEEVEDVDGALYKSLCWNFPNTFPNDDDVVVVVDDDDDDDDITFSYQ
jgi:hypothetical protein